MSTIQHPNKNMVDHFKFKADSPKSLTTTYQVYI